ncbi:ATP-binding protein [Roseococcus sp. YIM B11640]|uniref:ATP-binding protein n=1 Tax=Roseococcus sp. YIM B11640 TaxID=3133973 RepID=UPI003C7D6D04
MIPEETTRSAAASPEAEAGRRNMRLLILLRWIAVGGQLVTIAVVQGLLDVRLPLGALLPVPVLLVAVNLVSLAMVRRRSGVSNTELTAALLLDVAALAWQLHQTGGLANPFASLFLLQVVLGAMLLKQPSGWIMVGAAGLALAWLAVDYVPLDLHERHRADPLALYIQGGLVCFALIAVLLVAFVTRISANLRESDAALARARQQAAEENHIIRMGLLASGAAHELGTPLSSLSVILGDWQRMPRVVEDQDLAQDVTDMQAEVARCKAIVGGILMSAGEARGEGPRVTTLRRFLDDIVSDWRSMRLPGSLQYSDQLGEDLPIVSDAALKQVIGNVIDNAAEVSPRWIGVTASREEDSLVLEIADQGPGFTPEMLASFGQPYRSSKARPGGGLGLFLLVNVLRKLGGGAEARNREEGGALVRLFLPLDAIAYAGEVPR